jgi:glycosyltransferase involved in cell wall biosynthesis
MKNQIIFIDPRGVIAGNYDSMLRHKYYADKYLTREVNNDSSKTIFKLVTASENTLKLEKNMAPLGIINLGKSSRFSLKFIMLTVLQLRKSRHEIKAFICGDPWESFWATYLTRLLLNIDIGLQTNIHADISDPQWINRSFVNRLRKFLTVIALKNSSSIRVASLNVKKDIENRFNNLNIVYAPIPIMIRSSYSSKISNSISKRITIGWVGRLAEDRGVKQFVELLNRLSANGLDFQVIIAGKGALENYVRQNLEILLSKERINFLGQVNQENLIEIYQDMDIFVSCAESESYGLSIREALYSGIPVWAVKSLGVLNLHRELQEGYIRFLNLKQTDEQLVDDFRLLCNTKVPASVRDHLIKEDKVHLNNLFESWDNFEKCR